jgi:hypothetical protein
MLLILTSGIPGARAQAEEDDAGARAEEPSVRDRRVASELFRAAAAAFEARDFDAAAELFLEADERAPAAAAMFNAARAWQAAGAFPRAAQAYAEALARVPRLTDALAEDARRALEALDPQVARLAVIAPDTARVDLTPLPPGEGPVEPSRSSSSSSCAPCALTVPFERRLAPGRWRLAARRDDGEAFPPRVLELSPGDRVEVDLERTADGAMSSGDGGDDDRDDDEADGLRLDLPPGAAAGGAAAPSGGPSPGRIAGGLLLGLGVAGGATGIGLGVRALAERDRFEDSGRTDRAARGRAADLRLATNLVWGASAVVGAVGLYLLLRGEDREADGADQGAAGPDAQGTSRPSPGRGESRLAIDNWDIGPFGVRLGGTF